MTPLAPSNAAADWLTLSFLPGLGCTLINRLVEHLGSPGAVLAAKGELGMIDGVGPRLQALLRDPGQVSQARQRATLELKRIEQIKGKLLTPETFPPLLRAIADSPALLWCRGDDQWLHRPAVAVIGSRAASDYGRRSGAALAAGLAEAGYAIISGAAYGIDAAAHRGALRAGGGTVAVLGCGVNVVYPRTHADLYADILAGGLLLSEYPLGTTPEGFRFPARNRIISGLAQGVVVVEATEHSGSLITARLALDQGREVFAVPGRIDSPKSAGTHRLIQQGAHLVHTVADILDHLSWSGSLQAMPVRPSSAVAPITDLERQVLDSLDSYPRDIDTIVRLTEFSLVDLHGLLLQLELKGLVRQLAGQQFERVGDGGNATSPAPQ